VWGHQVSMWRGFHNNQHGVQDVSSQRQSPPQSHFNNI
jgi:hypothetical protein